VRRLTAVVLAAVAGAVCVAMTANRSCLCVITDELPGAVLFLGAIHYPETE
jgi:serine protease inhibitor